MIKRSIYLIFLCFFITTPTHAEQSNTVPKLEQLARKNFFHENGQTNENREQAQEVAKLRSFLKDYTPQGSMADGGWSGGGGGGIQCNGRVYTLDYFEYKDHLNFFQVEEFAETIVNNKIRTNPDLKNKKEELLAEANKVKLDTHSFLYQNVVGRMRFISPILTERLGHALETVSKNGWYLVDNLPLWNDVGASTVYPAGCEPVQLAIRFQQKDADGFPRTIVFIDRNNLQKMLTSLSPQEAFLNLSMLILHETTYLLGMDMGQENSAQARKITASLFSKDFYNRLETNGYWSASIYDYISEFDFLPVLFAYEPANMQGPLAERNRSRLKAFERIQTALQKIRPEAGHISTNVKGKFLEYLSSEGSPEEIFLELGRQAQSQKAMPYSVEYLFVNQSLYLSERAENALCSKIYEWENQARSNPTSAENHYIIVHLGQEKGLAFLQKGRAYCQSILP